jgi:hypothetical protein
LEGFMARLKKLDGTVIGGGSLASLSALMGDLGLSESEVVFELTSDEIRAQVRLRIEQSAGDTASLRGTASDAASLAIFGLASLVAKLAEANTLSDVRAAAAPFAEMSGAFLAKVEAGDVKLPFMTKGVDATIADIETRATAVTDALQSAD